MTSPRTADAKSNTGAIAGGVVGGIIALAMMGGIVFWWLHRRRRLTYQQTSKLNHIEDEYYLRMQRAEMANTDCRAEMPERSKQICELDTKAPAVELDSRAVFSKGISLVEA